MLKYWKRVTFDPVLTPRVDHDNQAWLLSLHSGCRVWHSANDKTSEVVLV